MPFTRREMVLQTTAMAATVALPATALAFSKSQNWAAIKKLIDSYISEKRYAGIAIALSSDSSRATYLNSGSLGFDSKSPVTQNSIFRIYSVTKVFTAVLTHMMVEDGLLKLDQPVADVLPQLAQMTVAIDPANSLEARPAKRPITIEQLITHTSGLSNWQPFLGNSPISNAYRQMGLTPGAYGIHKTRPGYGAQVTGFDALIAGLADLPLIADPGEAWNYSIGFDVMGAVIEKVTGKNFATVMDERILQPLGMSSSGFQADPSQAHRMTTLYGRTRAETYVIDEGPTSGFLRAPTLLAGGGGLVSSARDMSKFAAMLLDSKQAGSPPIAKARTIETAMRLYSNQRGSVLGSRSTPSGDTDTTRATISALGASSTMLHVDPASRSFIIFLTQLNRTGSAAEATIYRQELLNAYATDLQRGK